MQDIEIKAEKKFIAHEVGWVYHDLKWLSENEARQINIERDALLNSLSKKTEYSFGQTKIHTGKLSPGCAICGGGYWQCLYINALCTADCFYCTRVRKVKKEGLPSIMDKVEFSNAKNYTNFFKKFNFKGVGFSGGEPFLVFNRLLTYITEIREKLGEKIYLWMYTNGDLVNESKLKQLKKVGLNEIRFDLSARNYDLKPVELACGIFRTVTVEIPAIPEDIETVKRVMFELKKLGVRHLNLHQLDTNALNYKNFIKRGYTLLHNPEFAVSNSELVALKLISFSLAKNIDLPINYCSNEYKNKFQIKGDRRWMVPLVKRSFEEVTESNIIRRLSIQGLPEQIDKIIKTFKKNKFDNKFWEADRMSNEVCLHSSLLKYINFSKFYLKVSYFDARLSASIDRNFISRKANLFTKDKTFIIKMQIMQRIIKAPATIESFIKLFIKKMEEKGVFHDLYKKHNLTFKSWSKEVEQLLVFKTQEKIITGFPELF